MAEQAKHDVGTTGDLGRSTNQASYRATDQLQLADDDQSSHSADGMNNVEIQLPQSVDINEFAQILEMAFETNGIESYKVKYIGK